MNIACTTISTSKGIGFDEDEVKSAWAISTRSDGNTNKMIKEIGFTRALVWSIERLSWHDFIILGIAEVFKHFYRIFDIIRSRNRALMKDDTKVWHINIFSTFLKKPEKTYIKKNLSNFNSNSLSRCSLLQTEKKLDPGSTESFENKYDRQEN